MGLPHGEKKMTNVQNCYSNSQRMRVMNMIKIRFLKPIAL